jgi:hypothetical protein
MQWPPSKFQTCEDAYMLVRSEPEESKIQSAIEFVRQVPALHREDAAVPPGAG